MMSSGRSGNRGFTLVEMVVSIAIFAIISVAIYATIARFMEMNVELKQRTDQMSRLNVLFMLLERDIHNYIDRPVRGAYGGALPAYQSYAESKDQTLLFEMTIATPSYQQTDSASLSRVGWLFRDNSIVRQSWDVLDRAQDSEPHEELLLDGVEDIVVKYYINKDKKYIIDNQWTSGSAPPGIVITLTLANGPSYRRVFDFAGG